VIHDRLIGGRAVNRALSVGALAACAAAIWWLLQGAGTQRTAAQPSGESGGIPSTLVSTRPRLPDGTPNLQGYWDALEYTDGAPRQAPFALDLQASEKTAWREAHRTLVVDPPTGKIPYQEWAVKKRYELVSPEFIEYIGGVDPHVKCFRNAPPRQIYAPGGVQILQSPGQVVIVHEWDANYRVVPTDGRPHIGKASRCTSATRAGDGMTTPWSSRPGTSTEMRGSVRTATSRALIWSWSSASR
jgi:hypothetical protein